MSLFSAPATVNGTIVSNLVALNRKHEILKVLQRLIMMSVVSTALIIVVVILINPTIALSIFTDNKQLMADTVSSLYVICGSCILFAIASVLLAAVSGMEATKASLLIEITTLVFYLGSSYVVAIKWNWPIELVWCTEYVYFIFIGALSYLYLKRIKVIG